MKNQYKTILFPYGKSFLFIERALDGSNQVIFPTPTQRPQSNEIIIQKAIQAYDESKLSLDNSTTVAIAINDPTRPIPNHVLLPPLLDWLHSHKIADQNITFFIATGTHKTLSTNQLRKYLPEIVIDRYRTYVHICDDENSLLYLGKTSANTPVYVNKKYAENDIKIVVGHIEPHHFMGFSGGVKSAAIGLTGRKTISTNHKMLINPLCRMGNFYQNPMRMDVEEIGKMIGVDLALNVILDDDKNILEAFFNDPFTVMKNGTKVSKSICEVNKENDFDLVICSAGGFPKDINLYQAQKAITHASTFLKDDGVVILIAECMEGLGSDSFGDYFKGKRSPSHVITAFEKGSFTIGPHKAYQLSLQTQKYKIILVSKIDADIVRNLFLNPATDINDALSLAKKFLPDAPKTALLPYATHIMNWN